ncbi:MAG: M28 family peptidase [Nannocystaceae bacterium]|nr:M28 family peptidase [Nannocystaceae bacterium]
MTRATWWAFAPGAVALALSCGRADAPAPAPSDAPTPAPTPAAAATPKPGPEPAPKPAPTPTPKPAASAVALAPVTADALRGDVTALADDALAGRGTPSAGLDRAAELLAARMGAIGLVPVVGEAFPTRVDCSGSGSPDAANVLGLLRGSDPGLAQQVVIVSAHYDHLGRGTEAGSDDVIFNGANDDASGVAAVLAIATALRGAPRAPRRSVMFAAFCGEELGLRGSRAYVDAPALPLQQTVAVVNLEMLGRADPQHPRRAWLTGSDRSDLGDVFVERGRALGIEFVDGSVVGALEGQLFGASDNWPFAQAGVVAHSISGGPIDPQYHTVDDEADRLDYDAMAPIVAAIADATWTLADRDAVPRWREGAAPG